MSLLRFGSKHKLPFIVRGLKRSVPSTSSQGQHECIALARQASFSCFALCVVINYRLRSPGPADCFKSARFRFHHPVEHKHHSQWHRTTHSDGETILTPASVAPVTFGKLFSCLVDGYVYGSPLILSNQTIKGATRNVLYLATENDSVYAFDSGTCGGGTSLRKVSLLKSGETPLTDKAILPYAGVTSTPEIDPTTGTLYVLSTEQSSFGGNFFGTQPLPLPRARRSLHLTR